MTESAQHQFLIRPAAEADVPEIARLIRELAEYEKLLDICDVDETSLRDHLFGERPYVEALVAEVEGAAVGFALYFHNYSTFLSKPGLYLEDLYVEPQHRDGGIGKALLERVVEIAAERGCGRVEWLVLDWNKPAVDFYTEAFGAKPVEGWTVFRLTEEAIRTRNPDQDR